jgi:hypothetical protein
VLRDEGEVYTRKLMQAGADVTAVRYLATFHDFVLAGAPASKSAIKLASRKLREVLGTCLSEHEENIIILSAFTFFHVVLSLVGIATDFVVAYGLLASIRLDGWRSLFLVTTVATSVTGFLYPLHQFLPSHGVGVVSLIVLAIAILARYRFRLAGGWRRTLCDYRDDCTLFECVC